MATQAFIAFHIVAIGSWLMPEDWLLRERVTAVVRPYIHAIGLWQSWGLFAPDPLAVNLHVEADVSFRDGSTRRWTPPRMVELDLLTRYQKERWRRWSENMRDDRHQVAWPDAARFVARLHADSANPPVSIVLSRRWSVVPPISRGLLERKLRERVHRQVFFSYRVASEDLR